MKASAIPFSRYRAYAKSAAACVAAFMVCKRGVPNQNSVQSSFSPDAKAFDLGLAFTFPS